MRQTILNEAILAASGDYIIMTDGDCIPKKDFVEIHFSMDFVCFQRQLNYANRK